MISSTKKYLKLKFNIENNGIEWAVFICMFYLAISLGDKADTILGIVLTAFPIWFFFREKVSSDILLIPISHKNMKILNRNYKIIKLIEWISFGTICFILQNFFKTWTYSIGFFIIFNIGYLTYAFTKHLKREF